MYDRNIKLDYIAFKSVKDVQYDGDIDKYVEELKTCNIMGNTEAVIIALYDELQKLKEYIKVRDERDNLNIH